MNSQKIALILDVIFSCLTLTRPKGQRWCEPRNGAFTLTLNSQSSSQRLMRDLPKLLTTSPCSSEPLLGTKDNSSRTKKPGLLISACSLMLQNSGFGNPDFRVS